MANSWGGNQITFCSFCNCLCIPAQLENSGLNSNVEVTQQPAAKRGCSEGICSSRLTCSWTNQKSEPFYGYTCGCHFCHTFSVKSSVFFFNKIVAYQEWLNCMVTLRTSDLKNKKPCITMTKESVTGLISITKTLSIPCCSTLFSRFLCHHFTTVKCCQTSSECRCDHGFSL